MVLVGRLFAAALQAITIYLLARWSAVAAFGACMALLGLLTALQTLGDLGASTFVSKEVAGTNRTARIVKARKMSALTTSLISAVGLTSTILWSLVQCRPELLYLAPLWIWLTVERSNEIDVAIFIGEKRTATAMTSLLFRRSGTLVMTIALAGFYMDPILAFGISSLVAGVITMVGFRRGPTQSAPCRDPATFREVFSESKHYWIHSFSLQARNVDSTVVALLAGPAQAAFYSLGARLLTPLRMVPTAMAAVVLPHASREGIAHEKPLLLVIMTGVLGLPYVALAAIWPIAIPVIFDGKFDEAIGAVQLLTLSIAFTSTTSIFSALLQGSGRGAIVSRISAATSVVTIVGIAGCSAAWGAWGAAAAYSIASALHSALIIGQYLSNAKKEAR